ncbi:N-acetyl-anhydromuranmyl-L-alanine amidase [Herbaspirillum rubrisubalbicans]|jgi:AmpD protein|uniref:1,6-anhydro-N-acetylmuramyl-L-alanine amidase AmpD n=2 Tax=Herbaspirillum rubrisubalbicans TaxID=80842 RepID=A0ABX9C2A8_9BURK|nr:1,6-anhydro-N-acetylmuramyl-L-alanine amidase AmpD [Herbaspirillum rubrisubalbicans]ALU87587.1 N-acetylmuramoyl-tripeptide amidase [Herbaspirillum rubrisubalbicans M1]MCP1575729.1 AmpD protein [Herbaspirillum rubrisubalbicans]NQE50414.1 N-acetyl-anhydromuranmyl-L-alanine amidase [Herbaspirillum rubrisubalbicans]QJP99049.1 1,6-anhydro-N-acetylmuramyl-L-alanine amidase AmpD [Herbaspirillum rubrisubalbicans Os34]RAM64540.1 N-acetyl-anhydromuranmyl-L-alanine amidase [Herbaspirillum rubrisubalbi
MHTVLPDAAAWIIDGDGWCNIARREPSPNCDDRPEGAVTDLLVIHNISLPPGQFGGPYIADLFCNRLDYDAHPYFDQLRPLRVSAHFLIRRDGEVVQFVPAHRRAWHAGVSTFEGRERCNDFSIGIELEGTDFEPFAQAQYAALVKLSQALVSRYGLTAVAGHEHIAPVRKTDPGPFFDWAGYHNEMVKMINHAQLRFPLGLHKSQA